MCFFSKLCFPSWGRSGIETGRTLQEPMATIQIRDLKSQQVEESTAVSRSFWLRPFRRFLPRVKKQRSAPASHYQRTDYSRLHIENPQLSTANGSDSETINDDGKVICHAPISLHPTSGTSIVDVAASEMTIFKGIANHDSRSSASAVSFENSTDVAGKSAKHNNIPPPKAHMATSSWEMKISAFVDSVVNQDLDAHHNNVHDDCEKFPAQRREEYGGYQCHNAREGHSALAAYSELRKPIASKENMASATVEAASEDQLALWAKFEGPPAPRLPSAKERPTARYGLPRSSSYAVESAEGKFYRSRFFEHVEDEAFCPNRASWVRYQACT